MNQKLGPGLLVALFALLCACASDSVVIPASAGAAVNLAVTEPTPVSANPANPCGFSPEDWCPAPAGDVCGTHHDTNSCKADARCQGMHYRGESFVACQYDKLGFATNCPTVGCVAR